MPMASISRWTLAYFAFALAALVAALGLIGLGFGYPQEALLAPRTLIVVHLLAIGWLSLLMLGALFQFLPVLVGRDLVWPGLAPLALVLILAGLATLLAGFAGLDGLASLPADLLAWGGLLLIGGFAIAATVLFATLLRARTVPLPAGFVAVALMSLMLTVVLGESLAGTLAGLIGGDFALALVTHGVPLHAGFGLGGWLSFAAMGVSYRLLSMFLIAPERKGRWPRIVFWSGVAALALLCLALAGLIALNAPWPIPATLAGLAALGTIGTYLGDVATLYRTRRRHALELHMLAAIGAFILLPLAGLVVAGAALVDFEPGIAAGVYLVLLGWLGGLGLAMLYKIVPFLTWLECFAPVMGRLPTPRVQDLVRENRAKFDFALYFAAVLAGALALALGQAQVLRAASWVQGAAVLLLIHQFYRARMLVDLPANWRNHPRPRLFLPARRQRSPL